MREGWPHFNGDFKKTLGRLKSLSQMVDREANAIRLRQDKRKNEELVEALDTFGLSKDRKENLPCYFLPERAKKAFFGREETLEAIRACFLENSQGISCVLLHGLGGVGKSTLAHQFASSYRDEFEAVLWVPADEEVKIQHAFVGFAERLGIIAAGDSGNEASLAVNKVKSWLCTSGRAIPFDLLAFR